jgi:DNA-binding HxlR family transcriptional regulator
VRSYREQCPLARALDVIGDRWAMLVVRELMLGPRRYTDLAIGLPGIGTNILADRLGDLQRAGVITKLSVPPPTPAAVYRLTEAGEALWPVLAALSAWGAAHGRPASAGDFLRPGWILLRVLGRPSALREDELCELAVDSDTFWLHGGPAGLAIETIARGPAHAKITLDLAALVMLLSDQGPSTWPHLAPAVEGDGATARKAVESLAGALRERLAPAGLTFRAVPQAEPRFDMQDEQGSASSLNGL